MERIPSPIPYLLRVKDPRADNTVHRWETMMTLSLMALACGCTSPLEISQWLEDERETLLSLGFRTRAGEARLPAQASVYRFFWQLDAQHERLEGVLQDWVKAVCRERGAPPSCAATREPSLMLLNADGKHLKGSKRVRQGASAVVLVSVYLAELGLTLDQAVLEGGEARLSAQCLDRLSNWLPETGWCVTGDAALADREFAAGVVQKGGTTY